LNGTATHFPSVEARQSVAASAGKRHAFARRAFARCAFARRAFARCAFTVMEVTIVVVVVGLLATVVLPQFSIEKKQASQISLRDELQYLRTQIAVFKAQHQDVPPGYPQGHATVQPNARCFVEQMTLHSDINCNVSRPDSPAYPYGPYLKQLPVDPVNNSSAVILVPNNRPLPAPSGSAGWIYKPQTQEIIANLAGKDDSGIPYSTY